MKSKETVKNRIVNINYEKNKISWLYYMPLLLIAGFVPLIVYGKYVDLTGTTQALYWTGQNQLLDFFSYWKSRWVIFLTVTALIIYIFLAISKKLPFKKEYKYYIPLGIYAFFVILSTIFAIDVPTALNGFVDMYQGMWVLLSYVTITFLVINFVNSERDVKLFLYAFIFLVVVEGLIGVGQYFGFDIFNTKFGNSLIVPGGVHVDGGLTFNFGKHTIYGTLFNTNFVGSFAALMLPMTMVFLVISKTTKKRVIASVALALCVFTWIGCNSRAGYVGVLFCLVVTVVIMRKYIIKNWKGILVCLTIGCIVLLIISTMSNGKVIQQISRLSITGEIDNIKTKNEHPNNLKFESIDLGKNTIKIKMRYQTMNIKIVDGKLYFTDDDGNELPMKTTDEGLLVVDLPNQSYLRVKISTDYPIITIDTPLSVYGKMNFYISNDGIKIIGSGNRLTEPIVAPSVPFLNGLESMASGRGYIWSRTIPVLNKYIIYGSGPDNFIYTFPQDDYVAKLRVPMNINMITDKPHNMYLQIGISTGVISLISLLILWSIYIISSIKLYWSIEINNLYKYMGFACMLSVIGYLVIGIFNDHIVSVSPLFWIILGLGININIRLSKKEDKNV